MKHKKHKKHGRRGIDFVGKKESENSRITAEIGGGGITLHYEGPEVSNFFDDHSHCYIYGGALKYPENGTINALLF